jgi:hypothetical protein
VSLSEVINRNKGEGFEGGGIENGEAGRRIREWRSGFRSIVSFFYETSGLVRVGLV